jgi:hypothetical protein
LNAQHYKSIEWALDISEATFGALTDFQGIPPALIRRNPQSHFVVPRESAAQLSGGYPSVWSLISKSLLETDLPGIAVALGRRSRKFKDDLAQAMAMREEGLLQ